MREVAEERGREGHGNQVGQRIPGVDQGDTDKGEGTPGPGPGGTAATRRGWDGRRER